MRHEFASSGAVAIEAGAPAVTRSPLRVSAVGDAAIAHVAVRVEVDHRWQGDLALSVVNPRGTRVLLARRRGGSAGDFSDGKVGELAETAADKTQEKIA